MHPRSATPGPPHLLVVLLVPRRQVARQVGQADSRHKAGVRRAALLDGPQQAAHHAAVLQHGLRRLRVAPAQRSQRLERCLLLCALW